MTDWVEGVTVWVLFAVGLIGLLSAVAIGRQTHTAVLEHVQVESAQRTPITVQLMRDPLSPPDSGRQGASIVRWTGPDGLERIGQASVGSWLKAGESSRAWMDRDGRLVESPATADEAMLLAIMIAGLTLVGVAAGLWLTWRAVALWALARNCRRWGEDWKNVERLWSGRTC